MGVPKKNGNSETKKEVHFVMQSKEGVGKSYIASLLCQYFYWKKRLYKAYDIDPSNKTLKAIASLNVVSWQVLTIPTEGSSLEVDPESFERLVKDIDESSEEHFVVDTGSTSFIPFNNYILETDVFNALKSRCVDSSIHCVLKAGDALRDCVVCLNNLCKKHNTEIVKIFAWLNEVAGSITNINKDTGDVKKFEEFSVYTNNEEKISGVIRIPELGNALYQDDIRKMISNGQTLDDYHNDSSIYLFNKARIYQIKRRYMEIIEGVI